MDGVLVDTYHAHFESWLMMAERDGLSFTEEEFAATFGRTSREIIAHFWGDGRYSAAEMGAMDDRKEAIFREIIAADFPVMPGAAELLGDLRAAGFKLGVGSSGPVKNVDLVVDRLRARSLFDAIITATDVTRGKPDPQVFLLAAERMGVPPEHCAVVEDAPPGIEAANAAGAASIGFASTGRTAESLSAAKLVIRSLNELSPEFVRDVILRCIK